MNIILNYNKYNNSINKESIHKKIDLFLKNKLSDKFNKEVEIGIHFATKKVIKELNNKYRSKNKPTDVLSFPTYKNILEFSNLQIKKINLGDVFLNEQIIKQQAKDNNNSYQKELEFLIIHSIKHLIGIHHKE